jgi:thioredoxin-related protein
MISINEGDEAKVINDYVKENKFTFRVGMNNKGGPDVVKLYKVEAFPTNYLVDANGKIIARFVGFDEEAMKAELRKAGFKI